MTTVAIPTLIPAGTWAIDPSHSAIGFSVRHLGIATVRGAFERFSGSLEAGEQLEQALAIDPKNDKARALLRRMSE